MSHHSSDNRFDPTLVPMADDPAMHELMGKLLGEYPEGKLNRDDEGALAFAVGVHEGKVVVNFPKPVHWFAMGPELAEMLGNMLIARAKQAHLTAQINRTVTPDRP